MRKRGWMCLYLLHSEGGADLFSSKDHGALGQNLRQLEWVQTQQLADVTDHWKTYTQICCSTFIKMLRRTQIASAGVRKEMWPTDSDPLQTRGYTALLGGPRCSAGTVLYKFFGKEVRHSEQRSFKLMLQPVQDSVCLCNAYQTQGYYMEHGWEVWHFYSWLKGVV